MPIRIVPPQPGRTSCYTLRGTYLGYYVERSTRSREKSLATSIRAKIMREIERGLLARPSGPGFAAAAAAYLKAGGDGTFLELIIERLGHTPIAEIDQMTIDHLAAELYPDGTAATRNRQVYTPISAVLKRAGIEKKIKRPKGWRGNKLTHWLTPEQAFAVFRAAEKIAAPPDTRAKFRILLIVLCYTGMRLSEGLRIERQRIDRAASTVLLPRTKNGEPRLVYLPPIVMEALASFPGGIEGIGRLFSFHAGGRLYDLLDMTMKIADIELPRRVGFHVWCHTWATWMRQHGRLDTYDLVRTNRWADAESANRYSHVVLSEQARRADLLPVEPPVRVKTG
jgi:integrase-like protein